MLTVMLLAAGRGERLRPLTDLTPKPLLPVAGKPLIVHHLERLAAVGVQDVVINHAWLGEQIASTLGEGMRWGLTIRYSAEGEALETGGGIFRALPLLSDPFMVINSDIWMTPDLAALSLAPDDLAQLLLVNNPLHNPAGDFYLHSGRLHPDMGTRLTFSGVGLYRKALFAKCADGKFPLAPLLKTAIADNRVSGLHYQGDWLDVGTAERLAQLELMLQAD